MMSPYVKILIATSLLLGACTIQKPIIGESATHHATTELIQLKSDIEVYNNLPPRWHYSAPKKLLRNLENYELAFEELKAMLEGTKEANFERAVFISENPYYGNKYSYEEFQRDIEFHLFFVQKLIELNDKSDSMDFNVKVNQYGRFNMDEIRHLPGEKEELYRKALSNWAIFTYITDTTGIYLYHPPFTYATHDPFGIKDWSNSQVIHLLYSQEQKGNCFALTAFYKILADRLNTDVRLCTAPQHIYIQHRDHKGDYYNVELATAGHPGDGTIQTLTHTTTEAIKSGIALRSYNTRQSIGLCLINLAKSYEHKFGSKDDDFLLKCAELVLKHDNRNLNALLLKQQILDTRVMSYALEKNVSDINLLKADTEISQSVYELEKHLALLYRLGYRQMPYDMQEIIMTGIIPENFEDKNPSPFTTIVPKEEHRTSFQTLYGGLFQEVFETREFEPYGHFIFQTATNKITVVDTTAQTGFLIDPVVFAYDFGARMYDTRVGRWLSRDPLESKYPGLSPYSFVANTPLIAIDPDGRDIIFVNGYYNTGQGKMPSSIAQNHIGTESGRGYWSESFIERSHEYLKDDIAQFVDGAGAWNSSGVERYDAGYEYAKNNFGDLTKNILDENGVQVETLKFVTHSMGAAYAEGMIKYMEENNINVEKVIHFSAADPSDFKASSNPKTIQINWKDDPVLGYKNFGEKPMIAGVDIYAEVDGPGAHYAGKQWGSSFDRVQDAERIKFSFDHTRKREIQHPSSGFGYSTGSTTVTENIYKSSGIMNGTVFKNVKFSNGKSFTNIGKDTFSSPKKE